MKRSTMWVLVGIVLSGVLGALLVTAGFHLNTWRYWAFLAVFIAYGYVRKEEGYNRRKEVLARAAMETFCDFLLKIGDTVIVDTEDSEAGDG